MIQRIQTIYLLLVTALMAVTIFSPLLVLRTVEFDNLHVCAQGIFNLGELIKPIWGVLTMAGLAAFVAFINIFLFKKRKLQVRLGILTSFFIVCFYITLFVYLYVYTNKNGLDITSIKYGVILPFVALILNLLAIKGIKADEKLVRSLNRIR